MKKTIIGLSEKVKIKTGNKKYVKVNAKIDTGADRCSIDKGFVKRWGLGPVLGKKSVTKAKQILEKNNIPCFTHCC